MLQLLEKECEREGGREGGREQEREAEEERGGGREEEGEIERKRGGGGERDQRSQTRTSHERSAGDSQDLDVHRATPSSSKGFSTSWSSLFTCQMYHCGVRMWVWTLLHTALDRHNSSLSFAGYCFENKNGTLFSNLYNTVLVIGSYWP